MRIPVYVTLTAGFVGTFATFGCSSDDENTPGGSNTIYGRLGGEAGVTTVVNDFVGRVVADPKINGYFLNSAVDATRLSGCLVKQIGNATGGPQKYPDGDCRDMKSAHAGLKISSQDFDDLAGHLVAALGAAKVAQADIDAIVAVVTPMKADIVEDATNNATVYQRVGRKPAIAAVIEGFVGRVAGDTTLLPFFDANRLPRLKTCLTRQVCSIDGPCKYGGEVGASVGEVEPGVSADSTCQDMKTSHTGLKNSQTQAGISKADFDALVGHLVAELDAKGVAAADKTALLGALGPLCKDIVADATTCD